MRLAILLCVGLINFAWGSVQNVTEPHSGTFLAAAASDPSGNIRLAYYDQDFNLFLISKPYSENWIKNKQLASQATLGADLAFDSAGNALVVWSAATTPEKPFTRHIYAAYKPYGSPWEESVCLSPGFEINIEPKIAFSPNGKAIVVWTKQGKESGHYSVERIDGKWTAPKLFPSPLLATSSPLLVVDGSGRMSALWTVVDGVVVSTQTEPEIWPETPQFVSEKGVHVSDASLISDAAGNLTALWILYNTLQVSSKVADGTWDIPLILSTNAFSPHAAINPSSGHLTLAWVTPKNQIQTFTKIPGEPWPLVAITLPSKSPRAHPKILSGKEGIKTFFWNNISKRNIQWTFIY